MSYGPFDLTGRVALVTGGSRGLGFGMAQGLAAAGASVVLNGISTQNLAKAKQAMADDGYKVFTAAFDATNADAINAGVGEIERLVGPVDILVNNAGLNRRASIMDLPDEDWEFVINADLTGPFRMAKAVAKSMLARGRGKIINITSIGSICVRPNVSAYVAAKGGLMLLTRAMAVEWAEHGIQANAIGPGYYRTDLTEGMQADPEFNEDYLGRVPAARWGEPEDLAGTAVFLASDASNFVNGQTILVDGGFLCAV